MAKPLLNQAGDLVEGTVHHHACRGGFLDIRYGFSLLFSRNVPMVRKALALGIGALIAAAMIALELPFESIIGGLLNFLGVGMDVILDGFEILVGPVLFAALLMPRLYRPKAITSDLPPVAPPLS